MPSPPLFITGLESHELLLFLYICCINVIFAIYRFETCWPAMAKDASGVILVSDADQMNIKDLESWSVLCGHCTVLLFMKLAATTAAFRNFIMAALRSRCGHYIFAL